MQEKDRQTLGASTLFRGIEPAELAGLCASLRCSERRYAPLSAVWLAGDAVDQAGVVLEGGVTAERVSAGGRRTLAARHGAGDVFGDVLMSTGGAHSPVDILAGADGAHVLFLPFAGIMSGGEGHCAAHDRLRQNLLSEIAEKFWALRRRVEILSVRGLRGRAAALLLAASEEQGSLNFYLGYNREDMADFLCVDRSALSRELSRLAAQGIVSFRRNQFRILQKEALEALLH